MSAQASTGVRGCAAPTCFASGPVSPTGPTHVGTAVLAAAGTAISSRVSREQLVVHGEQRLAESDAARIVVVDEDARLVADRHRPGRRRAGRRSCRSASIEMPMSWRSHISSSCATCRIANDRPTTPSRRSSDAIRQRGHHAPRGIVSQYARRVHLLLGQIELARADVLVRVELDLLEADDARDDVDFAVRSPARCRRGQARSANVSRIVTFV